MNSVIVSVVEKYLSREPVEGFQLTENQGTLMQNIQLKLLGVLLAYTLKPWKSFQLLVLFQNPKQFFRNAI